MPSGTILLVASLLALPACGGGGEKKALLSYEAAVESLMTEEEGVAARLKELREDAHSGSATPADQAAYGREQALPFYRRFREAAGKAPAADPRLGKIHARLVEYLDKRVAYVEAVDAVKAASETEGMKKLAAAQEPMKAIAEEMQVWIEKTQGRLPDREAGEAMAYTSLFNQNVYGPFTRGQAPAAKVVEALRTEILPRTSRLAERTKDQIASQGFLGSVARWAKVQDEIFRIMITTLPELQALQTAETRAAEAWDGAEGLRAKYLEELRAYRESLR